MWVVFSGRRAGGPHLLVAGLRLAKQVPTFEEYADEFVKTYVVASNKPATQSTIARWH